MAGFGMPTRSEPARDPNPTFGRNAHRASA